MEEDGEYVPPVSATKPKYSTYWFPVVGTRAEFMLALRKSYEAYCAHIFWVEYDALYRKRAKYRFLVEPAVKGQLGVPEWQRNWVVGHVDFAATIRVQRTASATGSFEQTSQLLPRSRHGGDSCSRRQG